MVAQWAAPTKRGLDRIFSSQTLGSRPQGAESSMVRAAGRGTALGRGETGSRVGQGNVLAGQKTDQLAGMFPEFFGPLSMSSTTDPWAQPAGQQPGAPATGGAPTGAPATTAGGQWAVLDRLTPSINRAAGELGVPANLIKAMLFREGAGGRDTRVVPLRGEQMYAFNGIFQSTAASRGIDFWRMTQDQDYAVWAMGKVMADIYYRDLGGTATWEDAAAYYFAGPQNYKRMDWGDETGQNTTWNYVNGPTGVATQWRMLDGRAGGTMTSDPWNAGGGFGGAIINEAKKYLGVAYNWGQIPGVTGSNNPWQTGWDCSGFTYWLGQQHGQPDLPQGSHYQFQWAQQTGRLTADPGQLRPGDLVFFDTGWQGGGGANLNRAGHVGIYIGDGQFMHAANEQQGTIISDLQSYLNMYEYLGGARMNWSGGQSAGTGSYYGGGSSSLPQSDPRYGDVGRFLQVISAGRR